MTTHNTNQDGLKALDEILCEHLHPDRPDNITPTEMLQTFNPGLLEAIQDYARTIAEEARIDELKRLDTRRHYGKDYQESLDELDDYVEARLNTLIGGKDD